MAEIEVWATALRLVQSHGSDAPTFADFKALEELVSGDADGSAAWEQVSVAADALLRHRPPAQSGTSPAYYLH